MAEQNLNSPEEEPISLEDENEQPIGLVGAPSGIKPGGMRTFGGGAAAMTGQRVQLNRQVNTDATGATRCRIFNSKIAVASLQHMENQINEWLEGTPFEVKHVGHMIGTMEGKTQEMNVIVMVWY